MRFRRGVIFGTVLLISLHTQRCFAPPVFTDFSSWQFVPESQTAFRYMTQCHGDADGLKSGLYWVSTDDWDMYQSVYTMPGGDWPAVYPDSVNYDARVDFDRNFIVNDDDGDILQEYFMVGGPGFPMDCGQKLELRPVAGPLSAGTVYTIEWDWNIYTDYVPLPGAEDNPSGPFELSYSTDDGAGGIIATVTDVTSYDWTVPDVNSTDCQLYIEDLSHPGLVDVMGNTFTILPWTGPVIGVDPNNLSFYFDTANPDPTAQILSIWNAGGGVLDWQITEDCDWLVVSPASSYAYVSVDTSILEPGQYQSLLTISDSNAINSPVTIPVYLGPDANCVNTNAPFYDEWVGEGKNWSKPDCWCYQRNCRGDADGLKQGTSYYFTFDLAIFVAAYGKADFKLDQTLICADFDHIKQGTARVSTNDLAVFIAWYGTPECKCPLCPMDWDDDGDRDYNFWLSP